MRNIILDGKILCSHEKFHAAIKTALNLPSYYGNNLDALADFLTDIGEPTAVRIINFGDAETALGAYAESIRRVFSDAAGRNPKLTVIILE